MRIGIDARLINETGVGRYIRNLVREIGHQDKINEYTIFLKKKNIRVLNSQTHDGKKYWQM